ncbi:helix-turn-helix domain-containing protein [Micromonospora aurantiaca (nom. illeg.)]|uniref:helix-turn-helix domain-containing protein n=1 Tax=Micromonospora aurantiaca (nom. illeg.) TaxID=47850 RepID=UPI0037A50CA2
MKAALLATKDLGKNERAVAIAIAAHANAEGHAWPSVATLADYAGCSERTVQRALAKLVQLGRLAVSKVAGIATRVYRLLTGAGVPSAAPGVTDSGAGVTDSAAGGDGQGVTRSSEDHSEEKKRAPRDWRRFLPKNKPTAPAYVERRGAALPMSSGGARCQRPGHVGQPAERCVACRAEALGGVA